MNAYEPSGQRGAALIVGLLLLALVTLLGMAAAGGAQVELQLASNERFRENAASAATAGIEIAIRHIMESAPESVPSRLQASLPGGPDHYYATVSLLGMATDLPQRPGDSLASAHFAIESTGYSARGATDRQRAIVARTLVVAGVTTTDCEPLAPGVRCGEAGELRRISWQRLPDR